MIEILAKDKNNLSQSKEWAEFQKSIDRKTFLLGKDKKGYVFRYPLIKGKYYLYSPKLSYSPQDSKSALSKEIKKLSQEEKAVFLRVEFNQPRTEKDINLLKKLGFIKPKLLVQQKNPEDTLLLDITRPEKEILAFMKPKTRYNIGLSQRKGVKVKQGVTSKDVDIFYNLLVEVARRDPSFSPHPKEYYEKLVKVLGSKDIIKIFIAEYKKKPLAAILISFYGEVATYLYGGSASEDRELMPTYLLQWEAICEAKRQGCKVYDFWGVAPLEDRNHPWVGVSRFKRGFGGQEINFLGTWDYVFDPFWYKTLSLASYVRHHLKIR